jgi:hypothetical protein
MKYILFIVFIVFTTNTFSQGITCRKDTIINASNKIEYKIENDSTLDLIVTLCGKIIHKEYYYSGDTEYCRMIPEFLARTNDMFIFISGTGFSYRLLTIFQLKDNKTSVCEYENQLTVNSSPDGVEKLFFLYGNRPALINIDKINNTVKFKLYKKIFPIKCDEITDIIILNDKATIEYLNHHRKTFCFNDFKEEYFIIPAELKKTEKKK